MRRSLILLAIASVVGFSLNGAFAERPNLGKDGLAKEATHVVTGTVANVYESTESTTRHGIGTKETHYLLEIRVDGVEKGEGLRTDHYVYARAWRVTRTGLTPTPGPSGHHPIPEAGQRVRAWLAFGEYRAVGQTDNAFAVVYPNGVEVLPGG